jgi:hypothetical protein
MCTAKVREMRRKKIKKWEGPLQRDSPAQAGKGRSGVRETKVKGVTWVQGVVTKKERSLADQSWSTRHRTSDMESCGKRVREARPQIRTVLRARSRRPSHILGIKRLGQSEVVFVAFIRAAPEALSPNLRRSPGRIRRRATAGRAIARRRPSRGGGRPWPT